MTSRCAEEILRPIIEAPPDRPFVVAQIGQSLDGRIATASGESRWINGGSALDHVHRLRAAVDAVVVGVGTVIADDPLLTVRRVAGPHPARVVIDPHGRLPHNAKCLADDGVRCLVIRAGDMPPPEGVEVIRLGYGGRRDVLCPVEISRLLFQRGFRRLLVEGGALTISKFVEAGAVDRLHVLVAPVILGSGKPGLSLAPIRRLKDAMRPSAGVHVFEDGDVLFDCNLADCQRST